MQHRITNIDHHHNEHEGSEVFRLTFKCGDETHEMLCAYAPEDSHIVNVGDAEPDSIEVTHCETRWADTEMDELVMERMARELLEHWYLFIEDAGTSSGVKFDITNEQFRADEEFLVYNYSGAHEDLPQNVKELLTVAEMEELNPGDWIVIADGEVVSTGEFAPHTISWSR